MLGRMLLKRRLTPWAALAPLLAVLLPLVLPAGSARAAVAVVVGPTPIVKGEATAAGDITVMNEKLAFSLAVQSAVPYGVPRGALIDLAPVVSGRVGRDRVVFADFIPDHWSAWPNTYQHVDIVERGPQRAVIKTVRDWGKVTVTTVYTLAANSDHIEIATTMLNTGDSALPGLLSGLTLWPNSGFFFSVPGLQGVAEGRADAPLAHRVVAYDADWAVALHADYFDHVGDDSKDLYQLNTLAPGQSRVFTGWLQVRSSGDLAPIVGAEIERGHLASGTLHGAVLDHDGKPVAQPVVMVEKRGKPYAWVLGKDGRYDIALPAGDYQVYATAKNYSQSGRRDVRVRQGSNPPALDFRDLENPGRIEFTISDSKAGALDARIVIAQGQKPVVEFLGRQTFFTELDRKGRADVVIAPGHYVFNVSASGGFLGKAAQVPVDVAPNAMRPARVVLHTLFHPNQAGWYSADLHHHSDQAEAVTPPDDLARSQLAAGLDVLFVSDHDSTVNHRQLQRIAESRGVQFIPSIELSASWGHFNAYPLRLGEKLAIDTTVASIDDIFREARRQGAIVVQINHPFIPYGYLTSVSTGVAQGGFNPGFDLLEINQAAPGDDDKVLHALWDFWNAGHHYYLGGGTDTHDVWNYQSGEVRTFAHVNGPVSAAGFAEALQAGHAYVTHGPLIFPSVMFGDERRVKAGRSADLSFDLASVTGLKSVQLIGAGQVVQTRLLSGGVQQAHVDFLVTPPRDTWFALVVEDVAGKRAFSDPIWMGVDAGDLAPRR
jgi:hypothetical protein